MIVLGARRCRGSSAHDAGELGLRRGGRGEPPRGEAAEERHDRRARGLRIEITGDDEREVVGHVEAIEEGLHVGHARRLEVLVRADHRVVVRVALGPEQLGEAELDLAVRAVLAGLAALVAHHVALRLELVGVHLFAERGEPVGLEPEQERERARRAGVVVLGAVLAGAGVVGAAFGLHPRVEHLGGDARGAHEHEVFWKRWAKPVRCASSWCEPTFTSVSDRHERERVILVEDHGECRWGGPPS